MVTALVVGALVTALGSMALGGILLTLLRGENIPIRDRHRPVAHPATIHTFVPRHPASPRSSHAPRLAA